MCIQDKKQICMINQFLVKICEIIGFTSDFTWIIMG